MTEAHEPDNPAAIVTDKENQSSITSDSARKKQLYASKANRSSKRIDPYKTFPVATSFYIQLRFQLAQFDGVYRTVKIPLNYTFANLHTLIQYLFGWNNSHVHQAQVYTHVEKHSGNHENGHMKRYGCPPPPPDYMVPQGPHYETEMRFWNLKHSDAAYYDVVAQGCKRSEGPNPWGAGSRFQKRVEDQELTLEMLWNPIKEQNLSKGQCNNTEIGVIYEYDLGASRNVHITLDQDHDFFTVAQPMNVPIVVKVQGAPPVEDAHGDIPGEIEAKEKVINDLLFDQDTFVKYCSGDVGTRACQTELAVFEIGEGRRWAREIERQTGA